MTGVEAVSNGVKAFREPTVRNAQHTLSVIIGLLIIMLAGIAWLVWAYGIAATHPGQLGYQSVLSMLVAAVAGRGWFYYVTIGSVLVILSLSANTAFADFPRLCKALAEDSFLPHAFAHRGRRLVYTQGILVLVFLSGILLVIFGGVTDRLVPLFAIGAFLAFTSRRQAWWPTGSEHEGAAGCIACSLTAWVSALLVVILVAAMTWVRRHYRAVSLEVACSSPLKLDPIAPPIVVMPIQEWGRVSQRALEFAPTLSADVRAVHVATEDETNTLKRDWPSLVEAPVKQVGGNPPKLVALSSPVSVRAEVYP
jgi:amino acid transporter